MNYSKVALAGLILISGCSAKNETTAPGVNDTGYEQSLVPEPNQVHIGQIEFTKRIIPGVSAKSSAPIPTIEYKRMERAVEELKEENGDENNASPQVSLLEINNDIQAENASVNAPSSNMNQKQAQSEAGIVTSEPGCKKSESTRTDTHQCAKEYVLFELDSSTITDKEFNAIKGMYANKKVELIGYADEIGNNQYNKELALRRAQEVRKELLKSGAKEVTIKEGIVSSHQGSSFRRVVIVSE